LGRIVFADPARLARLESLIHPAVRRLVEEEIAHTAARVVVIDAIKLLESSMAALCDTIWVVTAPEEQQLARLTAKRGMAKHDALLRIRAQPPQEEKIRHAQVVIRNDGSLEELERSVLAAWAQVSAATSDTPMDPA
jgi:dephospho-CoA kinase